MLHEVLLSLSGYSSPLLEHAANSKNESPNSSAFPLLSPPEKALLASLAHLSELHVRIKRQTARIKASHGSLICQAVAAGIASEHLGRFQKKILDVEQQILAKDAAYVGGYGIVPLSTLVNEFAPWKRRLEWLVEVANLILPTEGDHDASQKEAATGAALINYLRSKSRTGYLDLEEMAIQLDKTAESAWLRQLSSWILYGRLSTFGQRDFFIQPITRTETDAESRSPYSLHGTLAPTFVTPQAASSILFVGRSLDQIRERLKGSNSSHDPAFDLLPSHLSLLHTLNPPISQPSLGQVVSSIRSSISRNVLARLLPLPIVQDVLRVLQEFLLLRRGEFGTSLIVHADSRTQGRDHTREVIKPLRKAGFLEGIVVKDVELSATLAETWSELEALQKEEDPIDDSQELARDLIYFTTEEPRLVLPDEARAQHPLLLCQDSFRFFHDLVFPNPTYLKLRVEPPLDLFMTETDVATYSLISMYLLSIQRAEKHLNELWRRTQLRRSYPAPLGPPVSITKAGEGKLSARRQRENSRTLYMRRHWAIASSVLYVLSVLRGYLQGEVIQICSEHFMEWVNRFRPIEGSAGNSSLENIMDHPSVSSSDSQQPEARDERTAKGAIHPDPEILTNAHRDFLSMLTFSLLLTSTNFCASLRAVLLNVEHFVALIARLQRTQNDLDLEEDEGVLESFTDRRAEEAKILAELGGSRDELDHTVTAVIDQIKEVEEQHANEPWRSEPQNIGIVDNSYQPLRSTGIERLLIKLDSLRGGIEAFGGDDSDSS